MKISTLTDSIQSILDGRAANDPAEILALEYAKQCSAVNERLAKIALMFSNGGEIQALQIAEEHPPVVDLAVSLSFGGEGAWQEFCRENGHEVSPKIDADTLDKLLEIQSKGISPNHPLYKEYRAAISKRDDKKAFHLIRIITRMNPGDKNAAGELKRLQHKVVQSTLKNLAAKAQANDEEFLDAMARVEEIGQSKEYESNPIWRQSALRRTSIRRNAAWKKFPSLLSLAEEELESGDWRQAAALHGEFESLVTLYGLDGEQAQELESRAKEIDIHLNECRAEGERVAEANRLVAEMVQIAEDVETRAVTPMGLEKSFAETTATKLVHKMRQLERIRGEFPDVQRRRVEAAHARLTQSLARIRRTKKTLWILGLSVATVVVLGAATFTALYMRSSDHTEQLASLRSSKTTGALRELVSLIRQKESLLLNFSGLASELAEAEQWLVSIDAKRSLVEAELSALEEKRSRQFDDMETSLLFSKLQEAGELVSELPGDISEEFAARLSVLRNDGERVIVSRQEKLDEEARTVISRWNGILEGIDPEGPAQRARHLIGPALEEIKPFLDLKEMEHASLRLPASTSSQVDDLKSRVDELQEETEAVFAAQRALSSVTSPENYLQALESLAATGFGESLAAQRIVDAWSDEDRLKASLLFRGDLTALKIAEEDKTHGAPTPDSATPRDRKIISDLLSADGLTNLWWVEWKDLKGKTTKGLSRGELVDVGSTGKKGQIAEISKGRRIAPRFRIKEMYPHEGRKVTLNEVTPVSALLARLSLGGLFNQSGAEFVSSVIPVLDVISNDQEAPPLAKAYLFGEIVKIVRNHGFNAWGIFYCPEMIQDIEAYEALAMKAPVDEWTWLLEDDKKRIEEWDDFFTKRNNRSSYKRLVQTRKAAQDIIPKSFELAGWINRDGEFESKGEPKDGAIFAIREVEEEVYRFEFLGFMEGGEEVSDRYSSVIPYSPLLLINIESSTQEYLSSRNKVIPIASEERVDP